MLHKDVQGFRGELVFKARRPCVSLTSNLESNTEEEEDRGVPAGHLRVIPGDKCGRSLRHFLNIHRQKLSNSTDHRYLIEVRRALRGWGSGVRNLICKHL